MRIKQSLRKKYLGNKRKAALCLAVGFSIIVIMGIGYIVCKDLGRASDLKNKVVYVARESEGSNKLYYLQLKEDGTYVLMNEYVLGDGFEGLEAPPFIIYSYGTYKKKEETYDLAPERAVVVTFEDKEGVKEKKAYSRVYVKNETLDGYWIDNDVYQNEKNHSYLCRERNGRIQKWLYKSKRSNLPETMEEFVSQYTYEEE